MLERNPHLKKQSITAAMPYGWEEGDHEFIRRQKSEVRIQTSDVRNQTSDVRRQESVNTDSISSTFKFVYAGALLPKAIKPLEEIFKALNLAFKSDSCLLTSDVRHLSSDSCLLTSDVCHLTPDVSFNFIGTLATIKPLAEKHGLFGKTVFEHPNRMPYLDVLKELDQADGIFILGSTEPHYTPSKVYQAVLSQKPILALLHEQSSAVKVLREANAGIVITMNGEEDLDSLAIRFLQGLKQFQNFQQSFNPNKINKAAFEQYSAKAVTAQLVEKLDEIVSLSPRLG